jgi:hypothetical protein
VASYRVICVDTKSGTLLAEVPASGLSFASVLNGAGECSFSVPLGEDASAGVYVDATEPVRRSIVVERDGVIVWSGIVWATTYDDASRELEVRAAETWSYYRRRNIHTTLRYTQVDQFDIVRGILTWVHAQTGGDIGVTLGDEVGFFLRDREYLIWDAKNVGDAIEELADVIGGFDFYIDAAWGDDGRLVKRLRLFLLRRGRPPAETDLIFEVGRNVVEWTWPNDGTRYANRVVAFGAGQDNMRLRAQAVVATAQLNAGYPLIDDVISDNDVTRLSTLRAKADQQLADLSQPVVLPEVTVRADELPLFGAYELGDGCRFVCPPGVSPRFPDGIEVARRIVGWQVRVSDEGTDEVRLSLGAEDDAKQPAP